MQSPIQSPPFLTIPETHRRSSRDRQPPVNRVEQRFGLLSDFGVVDHAVNSYPSSLCCNLIHVLHQLSHLVDRPSLPRLGLHMFSHSEPHDPPAFRVRSASFAAPIPVFQTLPTVPVSLLRAVVSCRPPRKRFERYAAARVRRNFIIRSPTANTPSATCISFASWPSVGAMQYGRPVATAARSPAPLLSLSANT